MHRLIISYCNKLKQLKIHKIFIERKQKQQQQNSKNNHHIAASTTQTKQPLPNPVKDCVPMSSGCYKKDEETEKQKSNSVFPNPHYHRGEWLGLISGHFPHPSVLFSYRMLERLEMGLDERESILRSKLTNESENMCVGSCFLI